MAVDPNSVPKDLRPVNLHRPSIPITPTSSAAPAANGNLITVDDFFLEDHSSSTKKVKFLCSFGGKILPRPSDNVLRYVGGNTRIITMRKDATFQEVMQKMVDVYGGPVVLKYQLPDEDLDALVTVSCTEDLDNMMEEYDKLAAAAPEGSAKLRVFLFSPADSDFSSAFSQLSLNIDTGQRYVDAVNGVNEPAGVLRRRESNTSASSTQNSDGPVGGELAVDVGTVEGTSPALQSPNVTVVSQDLSKLIYVDGAPNPLAVPGSVPGGLGVPPAQTAPVRAELPPSMPSVPPYVSHAYVDPHQEGFNYVNYVPNSAHLQYANPQQLGLGSAPLGYTVAPQYLSGMHMTTAPSSAGQVSSLKPVPARTDPYLEGGAYGGNGARVVQLPTDSSYKALQTLPQLPPLPPSSLQTSTIDGYGGTFSWHQVSPSALQAQQGQPMRLEDCYMCQKALPHAHSDTLIQEHVTGSMANTLETFHSLQTQDAIRTQAQPKIITTALPDGIMELTADATSVVPQSGPYGHPHVSKAQHDSDSIVFQRTENLDQNRHMYPPSVVGFPGDLQSLYGMYPSNHPKATCEDTLQQQQQTPHLAPGQYLVKQDIPTNKPFGGDISLGKNGMHQTSQAPIRDAITEHLYDHARPVEGMVERLHVNPETTAINEQLKIASKPNVSAPKEMKPEINMETRDDSAPQVEDKELFWNNVFVNPGMMPEGSTTKPLDQPQSTLDVPCMHNVQTVDSNQVLPLLGDFGQYPNHLRPVAEPPFPHKRLLAVPSNANKIPVGDRREQASQLHPGNSFNDGPTPSGSNLPFPLANLSKPNGNIGDTQESAPSESLFSDPDPWRILQKAQVPSSKPKRVGSGESLASKDLGLENKSRSSGEVGIPVCSEEGDYYRKPSDALDRDSFSELVRPSKDSAEEQIKQEMQAIAEGVAASVLQSSTPHVPSPHACETKESVLESNTGRGVHDDNVDTQKMPFSDDRKLEDIKTKQLDKLNHGFQITEDLGRLQIIKNSDLEELRELGSGTFGTVYHGKWRGSDVAIKRINDRCFAGKSSDQERLRADFWNEACNLADLHHPNVVAFYGVVLDGPGESVATVTEYMVNGSLRNALQRNDKTLDRRKRLLIAMDVAFGMEYLHGKNIVHFDLKSDNLLVNLRDPQRPICKVGDLGLSKVKCQTLISGGVRGTLPWMAPELLNGGSSLVTEKVDVFSFGVVMWELLTGEEPYADLHYGAIIGGIVSNTLRPPVPESCDPEWRSLMEKCWASEPSERPSFKEIASKLRSMAASIPQKGHAQSNSLASSQALK